MIFSHSRLRALLLGAALFFSSAAALAQEKPFTLEGDLKLQTILLDNDDLGTASAEPSDSQALDARVRLTWKPFEEMVAFWEGRALKTYGGGNVETDTGASTAGGDYLEWRQSWVEFKNFFGNQPLSIKIGRQRFAEPQALWWNRDFDAVRLNYDTTLLKNFIAVGENLAAYRTSGEDFMADDEDMLRIFGESAWQWRRDHFLELRGMMLDDHSGTPALGSLISAFDRDNEDAELLWVGARTRGALSNRTSYRLDLMGLWGETETVLSSAGPGSDNRTVTGHENEDVKAWALDAALDVPVMAESRLLLGYAFGTGDDDSADDSDTAFRQSGLHSNFNRAGLASSSMNTYGSVLRPELSNLHVFTAGYSMPVFAASDVTAVYHYYRLADSEGALRNDSIDAPLNGTDASLGHGVDLMMNTDMGREFGFEGTGALRVDAKILLGAFRAGAAYGPADDEMAGRGVLELRFRY